MIIETVTNIIQTQFEALWMGWSTNPKTIYRDKTEAVIDDSHQKDQWEPKPFWPMLFTVEMNTVNKLQNAKY